MKRTPLLLLSILFTCSFLFFSSCNAHKGLPYLKNSDELTTDELLSTIGVHEAKIMPNDILSITVNSTVAGAATDFNLPLVPTNLNSVIQTTVSNSTSTAGSLQNYIVDKKGLISFPVLGELRISGMTTEQAEEYIASLIYPKYISQKPIVNIRFLNFKVSVLGEVARPGVYQSDNGQMTILDALASAGDMTIYGKRDNVLLVRTKEDGQVSLYRVDLQDKNIILDKNIFYLQQNDKLYVETNKARGNSSRFGTMETIGLSALSVIISIVAIATR